MNRIDRLTAILVHLQSKRVVTAQEIADRFEISLRTVYRDVRALEEAGVPIGAETGKGYFIMEGYHLPPVMFTQEEANALVLGSKLIESKADESIKKYFREAMLKIKSVLKTREKDNLEHLEMQIEVTASPSVEEGRFPNNFLADIQKALVERVLLRFDYYASYSGANTSRDVEPLGLVFYGNRWHLLGYCRLRQAYRDFRTDRIVKLQKLDEAYDLSSRMPFKEFLEEVIRGTELEEAVLSFDKITARYISEQKYYQGFFSEEEGDDRVVMHFYVPSIDYFAHWVVMLADGVQVVSPSKLSEKVVQLVKRLQHHYLGGN